MFITLKCSSRAFPSLRALIAVASLCAGASTLLASEGPALWRAEHRTIDLHQHLQCSTQHLARAKKIMDAAGIGLVVNLSGGTVTPAKDGSPSEFERNKLLTDTLHPGRILHYMNLDYSGWDRPDFSQRAVEQIEQGHKLGAAGLKEYKRLGLFLRDAAGSLLRIDDPKLDPVWKRCGELNLPISIHVADPKAFWLPYDENNERWAELRDHKNWWFGDTNKFPAWKDLLEALNRVIARHRGTTFVCVHFANNPEELEWVDASLTRFPNMRADLAARIPELGRHDPERVRRLFIKHQDRILFGTDFQVYQKLILGSSGNEPPPSDADAEVFFAKEWKWLETRDKHWPHMTPIQGNWTISSIGLPDSVLRKIYFDNARELLARSLPVPVLQTRRISQDFELDGRLEKPAWRTTAAVRIEQSSRSASARPELSTHVRSLWSSKYLYLSYKCPFTKLTVFDQPLTSGKRYSVKEKGESLWERDVIEAFIGSDPGNHLRYAEFEVAPTNERLDLLLPNLPQRDFRWNSGFESAVSVNHKSKTWSCEMRIPLQSLSEMKPGPGTRWRLNLFRCDRANDASLAWHPTLSGTFHVPERFGTLEFVE